MPGSGKRVQFFKHETRRRNRKMHQKNGFSFIELLVVIGIITVLAGIAIITFHNYKPTMKINGAARQIHSDLMQSRMKAVSENNNYVVAFIPLTNSYKIYDDNDNSVTSISPTLNENELIKSVSFDTVTNEFYGAVFGFVDGVLETDGVTPLNPGDDPVTFPCTSGGIIWTSFQPNGRSDTDCFVGIEEGIYLILKEDLDAEKKGRMRAITVSTSGKVKVWRYYEEGGVDKWK